MNVFEAEQPATLAGGSWLRRAMARRLHDLRLAAEIVDDIQLVVSEIAANAALHGRPAPSTLGVRVDIEGVDLVVTVTDDGGPFAEIDARSGRISDPLASSGRGLDLVRAALDRIDYRAGSPNRFRGRRSLRRRRATALVVEDTPALLETYIATLQQDYRVIGASSMQEAMSALRDQTIDIVLADVHLGDGLGMALPDEIAALDGGALPVVLISSDTTIATQESALRLGAEFYLSKPVRPRALRDAVALALSRAAVRDARLARRFVRHVDGFLNDLLPATIDGYRIASAGGTAAAGGGDLVLHLPMTGGARIVLIDVMGHGVAARAWAVAYAAIVRTLHHCVGEIGAGAFLTELARVAWNEPSLERALATVLVVDLKGDAAWVASAGHPPPLVIGAEVRRTTEMNALLGVLPPEPHVAERIEMRPGDRLAMFTDGLDPAESAAGGDPPDWFMTGLLTGRAEPIESVAADLRQRTETALGPRPADDWTFVIVEKSAGHEAGRGVIVETSDGP